MSQSYFDKIECLKRIDEHVDKDFDYCQRGDYAKDFNIVEQALQQKSLVERCWEICKKKNNIDIKWLRASRDFKEYNAKMLDLYSLDDMLTEIEFNTLKEGLRNESK